MGKTAAVIVGEGTDGAESYLVDSPQQSCKLTFTK